MRKILIGMMALLVMDTVYAQVSIDPLVHRVNLQLTAEQWVTTKNALITVNINASVNDTSLDKIQSQVLDKLTKLAKTDWHIISYDRSQDKSGLETVKISAQARLTESDLTGLRDRAKNLSKPGETYTIENIEFTPSDDEKRSANNNLRQNIYDQVKNELDRLNKMYPDQKYTVHEINFFSENVPMPMAAQNMMYKAGDANGISTVPSHAPMSVGDKMRINANVSLSTLPDPNLLKTFLQK